MNLPRTYVGVDVAKAWLDVHTADGATRRIDNTGPALARFVRHADPDACVVFEASGGYERALMAALSGAGVAWHRVNPRHARAFAQATGQLAKTDKVDARVLARMGTALELTPEGARDPARQRLADFIARLHDLKGQRQAEANRLEHAADPIIATDIRDMIATLDRRIERFETLIANQIASQAPLRALKARLETMPGIGPTLSAELIAWLPELGQLSRREVANLAGLAPQACDSGTKRGKRHIWGGRSGLRRTLYLAAFNASRYDQRFRTYRTKLQDAGKPTKVALVATARKLLTILNQMIRTDTDYQKTTS